VAKPRLHDACSARILPETPAVRNILGRPSIHFLDMEDLQALRRIDQPDICHNTSPGAQDETQAARQLAK
jgi:hypothetical protein